MLALLSCSTPRIDDYDPYAPPRRVARSLSFIKSSSRRKVSKMSIGSPENFRHEFHLGMDIIASDTVGLWDATRFLDELRAQQNAASTPPVAPSASPLPTTTTPTPKPQKRASITPQKRKPVPSLLPEARAPPSPADIQLPPSPIDIPLPPSPTSPTHPDPDPEPKPLVPLLSNSDDTPYVTQTVKARWVSAMDEIEHALRASDSG